MASETGRLLLDLALLIAAAKLGGWAAERIRQPAVLGELLVGVALGPSLLGPWLRIPELSLAEHALGLTDVTTAGTLLIESGPDLAVASVLTALAAFGAVLLLFEVGLESNVKELARVGVASIVVAALGIVVSFAVGYGASWGLAQVWDAWRAANDHVPLQLLHVFVGATLTATSVGITARVLGDMGKLRTNEARIILGAAVLDDIGGLLILAIVGALVTAAESGAAIEMVQVALIALKAFGFLAASLALGLWSVPKAFDAMSRRIESRPFAVGIAIAFALLMSWLAEVAGLASIVGAFTAGLLLAQSHAVHRLFEDLRSVAGIFVGFFFVTLGMRVDLTRMEGHAVGILVAGLGLSVLAIAAKLSCGFGVVRARASRLIVGVGMSPRGEVGLIFAALGLTQGVIHNWQYTLVLVVVLVTTFVTPVWLSRLKGRFQGEVPEPAPSAQAMGRIMEP